MYTLKKHIYREREREKKGAIPGGLGEPEVEIFLNKGITSGPA